MEYPTLVVHSKCNEIVYYCFRSIQEIIDYRVGEIRLNYEYCMNLDTTNINQNIQPMCEICMAPLNLTDIIIIDEYNYIKLSDILHPKYNNTKKLAEIDKYLLDEFINTCYAKLYAMDDWK